MSECSIVNDMIDNIKSAIMILDFEVYFIKSNIEHDKNKYLGCPKLLVDGRDFEDTAKYEKCKPFCREYKNGIPTAEE